MMSCGISIRCPRDSTDVQYDSTGHLLEFCKFASKDLELPNSSRNAIKDFTGCLARKSYIVSLSRKKGKVQEIANCRPIGHLKIFYCPNSLVTWMAI